MFCPTLFDALQKALWAYYEPKIVRFQNEILMFQNQLIVIYKTFRGLKNKAYSAGAERVRD